MVLNFTVDFEQEDNADFSLGSNDQPLYWFSQANTESGNTVSGWCVPVGREAFDTAMEALNADRQGKKLAEIERVTIVHDESNDSASKQKGQSNHKEYWLFSELDMFILIKGLREPLAKEGVAMGIVNQWNEYNGKNTSSLRFRVLIRDLVEQGFMEPLQISVNGKGKTLAIKDVLKTQQRVLTAYRDLSNSKNAALPYWAFSLPIKRSAGLVTVKGKIQDKKMILPVANVPENINEAYLQSHYVTTTMMGNDLKDIIRELVTESVQWATSFVSKAPEKQQDSQGEAISEADYMNEPPREYLAGDWQSLDESVVPVANPNKPAVDGQRKALRTLGTKLGDSALIKAADDQTLTFDQAVQFINAGNARANKLR